jgi:membrane protease YdiL (CAAX protease family)
MTILERNMLLSILYIVIAFVLYYLLLRYFKTNRNESEDNTKDVFISRIAGISLFGILPVLYLLPQKMQIIKYGLDLKDIYISLLIFLAFFPILFLINFFNSKKEQNLAVYPEIRKPVWSKGLVFMSAISWLAYIVAYEFLFRGWFLYSTIEVFDYWPSIIINVVLYALAHLPKGMKETVASIPFGVLLCVITLETGNILAAVLIHGFLGLINEWMSLKAHPKMKIN